MLVHGVQSMQNLKPAKEFRALIANEESLDALLEIKGHLNITRRKNPAMTKGRWPTCGVDALWAIWGTASENGRQQGHQDSAQELKEKYQQVFA